jgi:hypothetical protein
LSDFYGMTAHPHASASVQLISEICAMRPDVVALMLAQDLARREPLQ